MKSKQKIFQIQSELKSKIENESLRISKSIKWEQKEKFHITLFFLGETPDNLIKPIIEEVSKIKYDYGDIFLQANGLDGFPNLKNSRIVFVNILDESNKLTELVNKLKNILEKFNYKTDKNFHSHITIARVKSNMLDLRKFSDKINPEFEFKIKSFHLMKSVLKKEGSEYESLYEFNFC